MSKYFNPRLLNAVIAGTGMRNPVRPHVILGSEDGEFVRGDLMDANAIQEFIGQKIAELVDSAPESLDTLKELSAALNDDSNFATTVLNAINNASTYRNIPNTWDTSHSMIELIASINNDSTAVPGKSYLGTVHLNDLPGSMMQAELIIEIMDQLGSNGGKVIVFHLSSADIAPYKWEYTSAYGATGEWRSWVVGQEQSDWNQTDNTAVDYIKNKPNVALKSDLYSLPNAAGQTYVDLGLPSGTLWATMNIGASSETGYGNYYMYGMGSRTYDSTDTPYAGNEEPLPLNVDTAAQVWGGDWHVPTRTQMQELITNTTYLWVTNYEDRGINGELFTAQNGNSIFFPAAGYQYSGSLSNAGVGGYYFSSSRYGNNYAYVLKCFSGNASVSDDNRNYGCTVRAVMGGPTAIYATESWVGQQGYLTSHQDISGKEDKTVIEAASGATLTAQVGKYYTLSNVGTLAITLPTCTGTKTQSVIFYMSTGSTPAVTFTSTHTVLYSDGFQIDADSTYEINALWNGTAWVVAMVKIVIPSS